MSVERKEHGKNGYVDFKGFYSCGTGERKERIEQKGDSSVESKAVIWKK